MHDDRFHTVKNYQGSLPLFICPSGKMMILSNANAVSADIGITFKYLTDK